jgi:hypothetical protein
VSKLANKAGGYSKKDAANSHPAIVETIQETCSALQHQTLHCQGADKMHCPAMRICHSCHIVASWNPIVAEEPLYHHSGSSVQIIKLWHFVNRIKTADVHTTRFAENIDGKYHTIMQPNQSNITAGNSRSPSSGLLKYFARLASSIETSPSTFREFFTRSARWVTSQSV